VPNACGSHLIRPFGVSRIPGPILGPRLVVAAAALRTTRAISEVARRSASMASCWAARNCHSSRCGELVRKRCGVGTLPFASRQSLGSGHGAPSAGSGIVSAHAKHEAKDEFPDEVSSLVSASLAR
jgi:hypothetical protein